MKTIFYKDLKTYSRSILSYIFIVLIFAVYAFIFADGIFNINKYLDSKVNYELPLYKLLTWFITMIPILIFLTFKGQKSNRVDSNLYTSNISSFKIILAKILAIFTIAVIPLLVILIINIILKLSIFNYSNMVFTSYLLILLIILIASTFSVLMYILFKNQLISLVLSILIPNIIMIVISLLRIENVLFMHYLQGLLPIAVTLIFLCLIIFNTVSATLLLNKKRNIA